MATHLDLQEQEQLDAVKQFWKRNGNLVIGLLIAALVAYSGWTGWNWWQREQATQAGAMFDELDKAAQAADVDKATRVFSDLKSRYPKTAFAQQGGFLSAKLQVEKGQADAAQATAVATHLVQQLGLPAYGGDARCVCKNGQVAHIHSPFLLGLRTWITNLRSS